MWLNLKRSDFESLPKVQEHKSLVRFRENRYINKHCGLKSGFSYAKLLGRRVCRRSKRSNKHHVNTDRNHSWLNKWANKTSLATMEMGSGIAGELAGRGSRSVWPWQAGARWLSTNMWEVVEHMFVSWTDLEGSQDTDSNEIACSWTTQRAQSVNWFVIFFFFIFLCGVNTVTPEWHNHYALPSLHKLGTVVFQFTWCSFSAINLNQRGFSHSLMSAWYAVCVMNNRYHVGKVFQWWLICLLAKIVW